MSMRGPIDPLLRAEPVVRSNIDVEGLYVEHRARLLGVAAAITLDRALAEEIVQDAFAGLQRHAGRVENPVGYLQRSVVNLSLNLNRRRRVAARHPTVPGLPASTVEIDEAFDTEFETRLRVTLDEMIPKLIASTTPSYEPAAHAPAEVVVDPAVTPVRGSRRLIGAVLAVAATVLGLFAITVRDTGGVTPGDNLPVADNAPPPWYELIQQSLPERFPYVALTLAEDPQMWFVAINPTDGKVLEIQLVLEGYAVGPTTVVDATGEWVETAHGWSVRTPEGLFVSVECDIGLGGRDFIGPDNYCERTDGVLPFTKDEIRSVAKALATSLTVSIFDQEVGSPRGDTIDTADATALIAAAVPGQQISATDLGAGSDHIYNAGHESEASTDPAGMSVRILHGVYPVPPVTGQPAAAAYGDAAVVWMIRGRWRSRADRYNRPQSRISDTPRTTRARPLEPRPHGDPARTRADHRHGPGDNDHVRLQPLRELRRCDGIGTHRDARRLCPRRPSGPTSRRRSRSISSVRRT
jgi:hypothetical protein